jgi:superfamily II DNA or RNA helicase
VTDLFNPESGVVELREYQLEAIEAVRALIRGGKKNIVLCAPTGSGKTVIGAYLINESKKKDKRSAFVVDRITLIGQTSDTFEKYGIDHGVIQADHPKQASWKRVQICSAQTVARRAWPDADLLVIDEAHTVMKVVSDRITPRDTVTIGLTATPFTKGLAKLYDGLVNVTTTNQLIRDKFLSDYVIYSAVEPDMEGVKIVAGEWVEAEASKRALAVVGDVVQEYLKHGEDRKFICSSCDVAHAEELARQFNAAGIRADTYTYRTPDDERAELVREFRKENSRIKGLISPVALTKGFDVPDVSCVIMARPLRKSLAEHIQFFGRGLRIHPSKRDCIARDSLVLTDKGEIPIQHVTLDHKVWDGREFVTHDGAVCQGTQVVIEHDGIVGTPDHEVMTSDGWQRLEEASRRQLRITRSGSGGSPVRIVDDNLSEYRGVRMLPTGRGSMPALLHESHGVISQHSKAPADAGVSTLQCSQASVGAEVVIPALPSADGPLHKSIERFVRAIRWSRNQVSVFFGKRGRPLDSFQYRSPDQKHATGQSRQQWALPAGQPSLDDRGREHEQHQGIWSTPAFYGFSTCVPKGAIRRPNACALDTDWTQRRADCRAIPQTFKQTKREVWDILNAGSLQRFTVNGRLVHNCIVLDHSGNCARFYNDWTAFFETGCLELDDGKPKPKAKKKEDDEPNFIKCPGCTHLHPPMPKCPRCGYEHKMRSKVVHEAGTLKELIASGNRQKLTAEVWPQVCEYVRARREGDAARKMALALYKQMTGQWPKTDFHLTQPAPVTPAVAGKIRSLNIAYANRRREFRA